MKIKNVILLKKTSLTKNKVIISNDLNLRLPLILIGRVSSLKQHHISKLQKICFITQHNSIMGSI